MKRLSYWRPAALVGALLVAGAAHAQTVVLPENDYPTAARADYVYGCMQANGENRQILMKCSCSIDEIAALLPFDKYETAETLMSVGQRENENASWLLHAPRNVNKINELKLAQVEAELLCF